MNETVVKHGATLDGLDSRGAIVTGGANGIGAAIARRLTGTGVRVVVLDVEDAGDIETLTVDLADPAAVLKRRRVPSPGSATLTSSSTAQVSRPWRG